MQALKGFILDELRRLTAANWSEPDDDFTEWFTIKNLRQFWQPEEVSLQEDSLTYPTLAPEQRDTFEKGLARLTLLDTIQGDIGMDSIARHVKSHQKKATLTFMGGMENAVHARSYSTIFQTLATRERIRELYYWVESSSLTQHNAKLIVDLYESIEEGDDISLYKAMVASVALESFLFYSGFFYPLFLAGQGLMVGSGEIINLILRDEAIHGVYVGLLAQEIYNKQDQGTKVELSNFVESFFDTVLYNEMKYTRYVYDPVNLSDEVIDFVKYNANKALNNLGFDGFYVHDDVNPIVLNGLNTNTKNHDFFSTKGNGYKKAIVMPLEPEDFVFDVPVINGFDMYTE